MKSESEDLDQRGIGSASAGAGTGAQGGSPDANALDVLLEQERKLVDAYETRAASAEARAAGALTVAGGLAVLTVTIANSDQKVTRILAAFALVLLALVVIITVVTRSGAGRRLRQREPQQPDPGAPRPLADDPGAPQPSTQVRWLSSESNEYRVALTAMRHLGAGDEPVDAIVARRRALLVWRTRAVDAHRFASKREVWATAAGVVLGLALLLLAVSQFLAAVL